MRNLKLIQPDTSQIILHVEVTVCETVWWMCISHRNNKVRYFPLQWCSITVLHNNQPVVVSMDSIVYSWATSFLTSIDRVTHTYGKSMQRAVDSEWQSSVSWDRYLSSLCKSEAKSGLWKLVSWVIYCSNVFVFIVFYIGYIEMSSLERLWVGSYFLKICIYMKNIYIWMNKYMNEMLSLPFSSSTSKPKLFERLTEAVKSYIYTPDDGMTFKYV